jgi:HD-like signal output (HDOD) protein
LAVDEEPTMNSPATLNRPPAQREPLRAVARLKPNTVTPAQNLLDQISSSLGLAGFGIDVAGIGRLGETGDRATQQLAHAVLSEPFIAQKIIRAANVVRDLRGNPAVTTISKAIALLGLEQVRALALSTLPVDRLRNKQQAARVREELSRSLYAATLAREIAVGHTTIDPEEAAVCALFRGYGRLIATVYLYEPYAQALDLARDGQMSPNTAAVKALGMDIDQLGVEALIRMGMPERIVQAAYACPAHIRPSTSPQIYLRTLAEFCVEAADAVREPQPDAQRRRVEALLDRFSRALGVTPRRLQAALRSSDEHSSERGPAKEALVPVRGGTPLDENRLVTLSPANRPGALLTLGAGVASLSRMFERGEPPKARLRHAANVLQRAYHFQRVILCLKDAAGVFRAQIVSGKAPDTRAAQFGFKEMAVHDLFNAAVLQSADIYIRDATEAKLQQNLPEWFKLTCPDARSFLLLSISGAGGTVGFFYADHADKNVPGLTGEEAQLVKTLKLLAWVAVHQAQSGIGTH